MPRISESLEHHLRNTKQSLSKIDISLKYPENITKAFNIYEKIKPIKDLEKIFPKLRNGRKDISKKLYANVQSSIDQIQKAFKLQDEKIYQLNQEKDNLTQRLKDAEFQKELLISEKSLKSDDFKENLKKIEQNIDDYENSLKQIQGQIFGLSQEKHKYDFSFKLDFQFATKALEYIELCEKIGGNHLKKMISDPYELLIQYIKEYGANLDKGIHENFSKASQYDSPNGPLSYSFELELKTTELQNLKRVSKISEIIDANDKVNNWTRVFGTFYRELNVILETANHNQNFEELLKNLTVSQALICLDSFLKENGQSFEQLYIFNKGFLLNATRDIHKKLLDCLSNQEFALANQELMLISDKALNPRDLSQIKFDLQVSLNKLMKETILTVRVLDDSIEGGFPSDKLNLVNANIERAEIALNQAQLMNYLDARTKAELENFKTVINGLFSTIFLKSFKSIENFLGCDCFNEAETGLEIIKKVIGDLNQVKVSNEVESKIEEFKYRIEKFAGEIMKRDYSEMKNYALQPPKEILDVLKNLSAKNNKFRAPYIYLQEAVRNTLISAISKLKKVSFEQSTEQIREIRFALKWVSNDLREELIGQLDEEERSIIQNEQSNKNELDSVLNFSTNDDQDIRRIGELAKIYKDKGRNDYFYKLTGEVLKRIRQYQAYIQNKLASNNEDLFGALEDFKVVFKYKESVGSFVLESINIYDSISTVMNNALISNAETIASIASIGQVQLIETALQNVFAFYRFSNTFEGKHQNFLTDKALEISQKGFKAVETFLERNFYACKMAIADLNISDIVKYLTISQKYENVLLEIKKASIKFNFLENFVKIFSYEEITNELKNRVIEYTEEKKNIELITEQTRNFIGERENLYKGINLSINKLKEISIKLNDFLGSKINLEDLLQQLITEIDIKLKIIEDKINEEASKEKLSQSDCDYLRVCYQHLDMFSKCVNSTTLDVKNKLESAEKKIFAKVETIKKEILNTLGDPGKVAEKLIDVAFFADNLYMFQAPINKIIDEILDKYKKLNGQAGISTLSMQLQTTDSGSRIIAEHSALAGEDWRKRREKMQKQDDLKYILSELRGDDLDNKVLTRRYQEFKTKYEELITKVFANSKQDENLDWIVSQTKIVAAKAPKKIDSKNILSGTLRDIIPELMAYIFAL